MYAQVSKHVPFRLYARAKHVCRRPTNIAMTMCRRRISQTVDSQTPSVQNSNGSSALSPTPLSSYVLDTSWAVLCVDKRVPKRARRRAGRRHGRVAQVAGWGCRALVDLRLPASLQPFLLPGLPRRTSPSFSKAAQTSIMYNPAGHAMYGHRSQKIGHPVRSAILKLRIGESANQYYGG